MSTILRCVWLCAGLLGAGCGLLDAPTKATISPQGGTISHGDVSVEFPPGAFAESAPVVLSSQPVPADGSEAALSKAYQLELPAQPLQGTLVVRLQGVREPTQAGETAHLGWSEASWPKGLDGASAAPATSVLPAELKGGTLVANVQLAVEPTPTSAPPDTPTWPVRKVSLFALGASHEQSEHFLVRYSSRAFPQAQPIQALLASFERAYAKLRAMGYLSEDAERKFWELYEKPMLVHVKSMEEGGMFRVALRGQRFSYIDVKAGLVVPGTPELEVVPAHELFHAVQNAYDPRLFVTKAMSGSKHFLWLSEASSTWLEARVHPDPAYVPSVYVNNMHMHVYGLQEGASYPDDVNVSEGGLGYYTAGFFAALARQKGEGFLLGAWQNVAAQQWSYGGLSALSAAVPDLPQAFEAHAFDLAANRKPGFPQEPNLAEDDRVVDLGASGLETKGIDTAFERTLAPFSFAVTRLNFVGSKMTQKVTVKLEKGAGAAAGLSFKVIRGQGSGFANPQVVSTLASPYVIDVAADGASGLSPNYKVLVTYQSKSPTDVAPVTYRLSVYAPPASAPPPPPPNHCTGGPTTHSFTVGPHQDMRVAFTLTGVELCKTTPGAGTLALKGRVCAGSVRLAGQADTVKESWELKTVALKTSTESASAPAAFIGATTPSSFDLTLTPKDKSSLVELIIDGQRWAGGTNYYTLSVTGDLAGQSQTVSSSWCR